MAGVFQEAGDAVQLAAGAIDLEIEGRDEEIAFLEVRRCDEGYEPIAGCLPEDVKYVALTTFSVAGVLRIVGEYVREQAEAEVRISAEDEESGERYGAGRVSRVVQVVGG